MINFLENNYKKYPKSGIEDFVKVFYQSIYGPGHLIKNPVASLYMIKEEISSLKSNSYKDLYEYIGYDYVRINLSPYKTFNLNANTLNDQMLDSINMKPTSKKDFEENLIILEKFLYKYFDNNVVNDFLQNYKNNDCPLLHHSEAYRNAYNPHYRIIHKKLLNEELRFYQVIHYLEQLQKQSITFIAMDGRSCSAKTTICDLIEKENNVTIIHVDDFFDTPKPKEIGINSERIINEVFNEIQVGKPLTYRKYQCSTKTYKNVTIDMVHPVIIFEGVYSANPELLKKYQGIIFVDIDDDLQLERLKFRSNLLLSRFQNEWLPRENKYFIENNIRYKANIIV